MVGEDRIGQLLFLTGCTKTSFHDPRNPDSSGYIVKLESLEEFAHLIIHECASVGFDAAYPSAGVKVMDAIIDHFELGEEDE